MALGLVVPVDCPKLVIDLLGLGKLHRCCHLPLGSLHSALELAFPRPVGAIQPNRAASDLFGNRRSPVAKREILTKIKKLNELIRFEPDEYENYFLKHQVL